jgi:hypothetical protein
VLDSLERVRDVTVGEGKLAGKGVYAARDFQQGEMVVPYNLRELTQTEYYNLPPAEREWTHSFHGQIWLFPEPERYVNHADDPNTCPDHDKGGNVALRAIRAGEAITIDDRRELQHELDTFLNVYIRASRDGNSDALAALIAEDAVYWSADGAQEGRSAILNAFADARSGTAEGQDAPSDVAWVATNYWVSACTFTVDGERRTLVLGRLSGSWRATHGHSSRA